MGWQDEAVVLAIVPDNDDLDDDNVLDSWDKEDATEQPRPGPKEAKEVAAPLPKRTQTQVPRDLSREEQELAVKLSDLHSAMDLFGLDSTTVDASNVLGAAAVSKRLETTNTPHGAAAIEDGLHVARTPATQPEAEALARRVGGQVVTKLGCSPHFVVFMEGVLRHALSGRDAPELRRLATFLTDLAAVKHKKTNAKKSVSLAQASKKSGRGVDYNDGNYDDDYDDECGE